MIGYDPNEYQFVNFVVLFKAGIVFSVSLGVLLGLISVLLHLMKLSRVSRVYSYFMLLWVVFVGLFMPVSVSMGMVDPGSSPIDAFNLIVSVVVVACLSIAGLTAAGKYIQVFILVALITSIVPAVYSIYHSGIFRVEEASQAPEVKHASMYLSNKKNILVLNFDGLPGNIITDLIKENKKYSQEFKDFQVFNNAVAQSPATSASMFGELFGVHDYKSKGKTRKDVMKALKAEGLIDKLIINQVPDSYQHGYSYVSAKRMNIPSSAIITQQLIETIDLFRYPIVRLWTRLPLAVIDWDEKIGAIRKYVIKTYDDYELVARISKSRGTKWDRKYNSSIVLFKSLVEHLSVTDKEFSVRFMHFPFTHFPVDFDENCDYRSDDETWHESNQNEQGLIAQSKCGLDLFSGFLQKLKSLGVYNNSIIVFKSDHGEPATYFTQYPNNVAINGHKLWGYNRYRPTLMIKDLGIDNAEITFKPELVLLNDLAVTLCIKSDLKTGCEYFPGVDLLGESLESDEPYFLYVVKDAKSDFRYDSHVSVKIPSRKLNLLEAMNESKLINLSVSEKDEVSERSSQDSSFNKRLSDINIVKSALSGFYSTNKRYPVSAGWDGVYSNWGASTPDYIKELVPEFLETLPVDPRKSKNGGKNYLYYSDGKDFKFLVHGAPNYDLSRVDKALIDPKRSDRAYGIWSEGGEKW
jgi:hypothetical protein